MVRPVAGNILEKLTVSNTKRSYGYNRIGVDKEVSWGVSRKAKQPKTY
jgi:hypothetical protein